MPWSSSLSPLLSLSLSWSLILSLLNVRLFCDQHLRLGNYETRQWRLLRGSHLVNAQLRGGWFVAMTARATCVAKSWLPSVALLSLATFDGSSGFQQVHLNLLVVMVPSFRDKSVWIVGTLFRAKWQNFASRSKPNRVLFWGNDLEFTLMAKKRISNGI